MSFEGNELAHELIELLIEDRISPSQIECLEALLQGDRVALRFYIEYMNLHGVLYRDAGRFGDHSINSTVVVRKSIFQNAFNYIRQHWIAALSLAGLTSIYILRYGSVGFIEETLTTERVSLISQRTEEEIILETPEDLPFALGERGMLRPLETQDLAHTAIEENREKLQTSDLDSSIVLEIDTEFAFAWKESEVTPSVLAVDSEWVRRVYLDLLGRIPNADECRHFELETGDHKRLALIDALLEHGDYVRNFSTIWTNLLIGRTNSRDVNRGTLEGFLRRAFKMNLGWDYVVTEMVAAEGNADDNGAANFLLAHLNNEAVPATAIVTRLFLCQQFQCAQCHDHPINELRQNEFWSLNSIFKEIRVISRPHPTASGQTQRILVNTGNTEPVYYESRNGVLRCAYPEFNGTPIGFDSRNGLRSGLAKEMMHGDPPQIARAFVNRLWHHFLGAAFTSQLDDMGSHVNVSHPQIIDRLSREFVVSGYDIKQLIRWITRSRPYQLSSQQIVGSSVDDPQMGMHPTFSHYYLKRMSVEQVFESVLVAVNATEAFGGNWEEVSVKRSEWRQQFVKAFFTDENDEFDFFDGSIPQALSLMNGDLVRLGIENTRSGYLEKIADSKLSVDSKIEAVAMNTVSRKPTIEETNATKLLIVKYGRQRNEKATISALQDLLWAYLNSNEFILIH